MIIVGLTGSIGMGKSTTAAMFAAEGAPVYDADAEVARLYAAGGAAVSPLEAAFPGVTKDGAIDRAALRERVLGDPAALKRLEGIVHPLLGAGRAEQSFALVERGETEGRGVGAEQAHRMRIEGRDDRRSSGGARGGDGALDHRLVSEVESIEIAQRDDTTGKVRGQRRAAVKPLHGGGL